MSRRVGIAVAAAVLAVLVLGGIIVWTVGGDGGRRAAVLEEASRSSGATWHLYGGSGGSTFWADLESVAGCDAPGQVATGADPETGGPGKHVSEVVPSACRLGVAVNGRARSALYNWINDALSATHTRQDLTLLRKPNTAVHNPGPALSISLQDALIERIELPPFDAQYGSGAPKATLTLTVRPEQTTRDSPPSVPNPPSGGSASPAARYFAVSVDVIDPLAASRFEPWSAAVAIAPNPGAAADPDEPLYTAGETSLGDLGFSVPRTSSGLNQLHNWFNNLVLQNQSGQERTVTFTVQAVEGGSPLLTLTFTNAGIFARPSYALGNDPEKFLLYAEGASFAGASGAP